MFKKEPKETTTLSKIKKESSALLSTVTGFVQSSIELFKKDESEMSLEEKVEKQHIMTFGYGMVTGLIVYHFLIGALLVVGIIALYSYSVKRTKKLMRDEIEKK